MKALEKDRARRYDTALELAQDVERHLRSESILAGSPSMADRLRKFARRHRAGVIAAAVASVALMVGLGVDAGRDGEAEAVWREQYQLASLLYPAGSLRLAELYVEFAQFLKARDQMQEAEQRVQEAIASYEAMPVRPLAPLIRAQHLLYELLVSRASGLHSADALRRRMDENARQLWGERDLRLADPSCDSFDGPS